MADVVKLTTPTLTGNETTIAVLEKLLAQAREGKIIAFAGTVMRPDRVHTIPVWSTCDSISALIGGVAFCQYAMCLSASMKEVP